MPCPVCHDFEGTPLIKPGSSRRTNRHHIKTDLAWNELTASAQSCYICDLLLRGVRGCLRRHNLDESHIVYCSIIFYYQSTPDVPGDIDKEIHLRMADGRKFEISAFVPEEGRAVYSSFY
jgi:hypothetical protein